MRKPSVSRVREIRTHGLKGALRCWSQVDLIDETNKGT